MGDELGLDDSQKGDVLAAFLISYTAFSPLVCWLEQRFSRRYLLALGVGVWSLATAGAGLAQSFGEAVLARAVMGIGEATYAVLAPTLISDLFPRQRRNRAMTIFYMAIPVGAALGYGIGGAVNTWQGWRAAFFVVGLPGLMVALSALLLREPHRGATEEVSEEDRLRHEALPTSWGEYAALLRNRSYVLNTLGMAMLTFTLGGLQGWTPNFLAERRGMEVDAANYHLGVVVLVSSLIGTPAGGLLADWLAARRRGAYFWVCGLSLLAAVPFILAALLILSPPVIFTFIFLGLVFAVMNYGPSNTIMVNVTAPRLRAGAIAVNLLLIHLLGDIPSPMLIGRVSHLTGDLFWGMLLTVPALVAGGVFYCLGARYLEADQEAVLQEMRTAKQEHPRKTDE
jgi:MFS family permease